MAAEPDTSPDVQNTRVIERPTRQRVELATAAVGLTTAVVTLILAFHSIGAANDKAAASQQQSSQASSQNATLQQQVSSAQATISALKNQLAAGPAATTDATAPSIYHTGAFVLKANHRIDLDSPADFPNWNEDGADADDGSADVDFDDPSFDAAYLSAPSYGQAKLFLIPGTANYEKCLRATGYSQDEIQVSALIKGSTVCVATNQGRLSMMHVKSASSASISMTISTYDGNFTPPQ